MSHERGNQTKKIIHNLLFNDLIIRGVRTQHLNINLTFGILFICQISLTRKIL